MKEKLQKVLCKPLGKLLILFPILLVGGLIIGVLISMNNSHNSQDKVSESEEVDTTRNIGVVLDENCQGKVTEDFKTICYYIREEGTDKEISRLDLKYPYSVLTLGEKKGETQYLIESGEEGMDSFEIIYSLDLRTGMIKEESADNSQMKTEEINIDITDWKKSEVEMQKNQGDEKGKFIIKHPKEILADETHEWFNEKGEKIVILEGYYKFEEGHSCSNYEEPIYAAGNYLGTLSEKEYSTEENLILKRVIKFTTEPYDTKHIKNTYCIQKKLGDEAVVITFWSLEEEYNDQKDRIFDKIAETVKFVFQVEDIELEGAACGFVGDSIVDANPEDQKCVVKETSTGAILNVLYDYAEEDMPHYSSYYLGKRSPNGRYILLQGGEGGDIWITLFEFDFDSNELVTLKNAGYHEITLVNFKCLESNGDDPLLLRPGCIDEVDASDKDEEIKNQVKDEYKKAEEFFTIIEEYSE